jgi:hypothetical protein
MKRVALMLVLAVMAVLAFSAGCTGSSPATTPTPTPTATPATTAPTPAQTVSLQPEPTDVMPADYKVAAQVQKDPIYRGITVTFSGGLGQENVKEFTATVIRSDGTTETKSLTKPSGKSLAKGQSLEFTGTAGDDRVQVWVVMDRPLGKDALTKFKILDSVLGPKGTK